MAGAAGCVKTQSLQNWGRNIYPFDAISGKEEDNSPPDTSVFTAFLLSAKFSEEFSHDLLQPP